MIDDIPEPIDPDINLKSVEEPVVNQEFDVIEVPDEPERPPEESGEE